MQVTPPCPASVVDYTAVILASISMLGNLLQLYFNSKQRVEIKALKSPSE